MTLDLFALPPTAMLTTEQVGSLGLFGTAATLTHNRCVGRPTPLHIKVAGRVFYRVAALLEFLAAQEAASAVDQARRQARYTRNARTRRAA